MTKRSIHRKLAFTFIGMLGACNVRLLIDEGTPDEPWPGNAPDCPRSEPGEATSCSVAEGQVCSFQQSSGNSVSRTLCGCWEASSTELMWHCYSRTGSSYECPNAQPADDDGCYGSYGVECEYPERTTCTCSSKTGSWNCVDVSPENLSVPPAGASTDQPINTLSDAQRASFCDWFATASIGPGYPEPPPASVDENGYTTSNGCASGGTDAFPCRALIPTLSSADCQANLALSNCAAPLSELTDCVLTVYDGCWPSPHGCPRYFERPDCSGTIAVSTLPPGSAGAGGSAGSSAGGSSSIVELCTVRVR